VAAERHGDGDGLSLLFSWSRRGSGNCRCRHASRGFDPCRAAGGSRTRRRPGRRRSGRSRSPDRGAAVRSRRDRVDGEIAFDRDLPCGGADRSGDRPERHAAAVPGAGGDHVGRGAGRRGGDDGGTLGQGEVQRGGRGGEDKRQEDGQVAWRGRWRHLRLRGGSWGAVLPFISLDSDSFPQVSGPRKRKAPAPPYWRG
jgi:hypothetical protein